jgi:hypothetical protein
MESPIDKITEWYCSLPNSHQQDIGGILGSSSPGFNGIDLSMDPDAIPYTFVTHIEKSKTSKMTEVGMVLMLRSSVEFYIISRCPDSDGWQEKKLMFENLAREKNSQTFASSARQIEFKEKQWLVSCKKWNDLELYLSDDYLRKYEAPYN